MARANLVQNVTPTLGAVTCLIPQLSGSVEHEANGSLPPIISLMVTKRWVERLCCRFQRRTTISRCWT